MMIDTIEVILFKESADTRLADISFTQARLWVYGLVSPRDEVVQHHHFCPSVDEPIGDMRADKPRTACDEDFHTFLLRSPEAKLAKTLHSGIRTMYRLLPSM